MTISNALTADTVNLSGVLSDLTVTLGVADIAYTGGAGKDTITMAATLTQRMLLMVVQVLLTYYLSLQRQALLRLLRFLMSKHFELAARVLRPITLLVLQASLRLISTSRPAQLEPKHCNRLLGSHQLKSMLTRTLRLTMTTKL